MSSRRVLKVAEAIREVVSMAILAEIKDPRVRNVTVTRVEVSPDLRQAKVQVSVMGNETQQNLTLTGLRSAAGFLQSRIADRIDTRYTPRLSFYLDPGVKHSIEIARLLREVLPPPEASDAAETDEIPEEEDDADASSPEARSTEPASTDSAADSAHRTD